ncbi:hypothetical protein TCAL_14674 [Tigriopus californicus]|uniref:Uncharacterized protein n=1 Tax=Tigriopus californicus TaxID=6832 RepID=A0A553NQY3_TIGCA|nr:hypothetical protein TCAL_14674 [Tigriopus californicus]
MPMGVACPCSMELARLFGQLYQTPETQPDYNMVFLLSAAGKINFLGSKRWLDEQKDMQDQQRQEYHLQCETSRLFRQPWLGQALKIHVQDTKRFSDLNVELVHKKINLAYESLAWEHERYSIAKLSALTLSHHESPFGLDRTSILDRDIDLAVLERNTQVLAETLACTMYTQEGSNCMGPDQTEMTRPNREHLAHWTAEMPAQPRGTPLLTGEKNPFVMKLFKSLDKLVMKTRKVVAKRDKRDPEFTFYDQHNATMNSYKVKPAVFDLVLTVAIGSYLGLCTCC